MSDRIRLKSRGPFQEVYARRVGEEGLEICEDGMGYRVGGAVFTHVSSAETLFRALNPHVIFADEDEVVVKKDRFEALLKKERVFDRFAARAKKVFDL